ncbi:MAG: cation transporter [Firmicutes bacterium]|nr:cation transporter [Bacillota bacterium]
MAGWLKRWLRSKSSSDNLESRSSAGSFASWAGIVINLLLVVGKVTAGIFAGSVAVIADGLNNLMDALGAIITLLGFKMAAKKADDEHPFGHGRYEYIAGLAVAVLVLVVGVELARSGITEILDPSPVDFGTPIVIVLVISVAVKSWMALFYRRFSKRIGSSALKAVSVDSRNDALATSAVFISALVSRYAGIELDGWAALGVSLFILYNGIGLLKETISPLVGEAPSEELVDYISEKITAHKQVLGIHDLIIHDYGPERRYVSAHVEMPSDEDPVITHDIIDSIERDFLENDGIHLIIHVDPVAPE